MEKKKQKDPKRKPKYGLFSCVGYIYRLLWQSERGLVFTGIFTVPISLALSALALYTPSAVLSVLETSDRFTPIALVIAGLLFVQLLCDIANNILSAKINSSENYVLLQMMYIWRKHQRDRDWYHQYDPEVQKWNVRADNATNNNHTAGVHFPMDFADMLTQILSLLLFGAIVSLLHPVVILLLALGCARNAAMGQWERRKNWEERDVRNELEKKANCISWSIAMDYGYAKDIRLYGMKQFLHDRMAQLIDLNIAQQRKMKRRSILTALVNFLIILIRDGAAYVFLISEAVRGNVDASSFVLYFSAITSLSGVMGGILGKINWVLEGAMQVSDFREAMEVEDKLNRGPGIPVPKAAFSIEFKNVSYQYPQGEKKVLDNISFQIKAGEKIALVGLNGAGKTTLTMLMCGMLLPDTGEILLDGHTLYEYNRDEMYGLFGIVPQQFNLLPVSIAQNIASAMSEEEIDRDKLADCIELAGLTEKIASLPEGADTPLERQLHEDGVELSGGEMQKLLLARLLYKNPPCIILDEPTAALDPIAEDRMYRSYHQIAAQATSIFISHRLASTNFCDRIFLLDGTRAVGQQKAVNKLAKENTHMMLFNRPWGADMIVFDLYRIVTEELRRHMLRPQWVAEQEKVTIKYNFLSILLNAVLNLCVFLFVAAKAFIGVFGIGSFILYQGTTKRFIDAVSGIAANIGRLRQNNSYLVSFYEYLDLPNDMYQGTLAVEKRDDIDYEIEFRDVSFRYPRTDAWALRHVSMKFRIGDKLAIVGENGSGKTTFIKLLCRLYDPTEGKILLNGIDITRYRYEEYMALFSVVFQDYKLLGMPLGENVAISNAYDETKVRDCLIRAGLGDKLESLDADPDAKEKDTLKRALWRAYDSEAIEFSGGELQKIALARALYKDAPFVVLDEPTAALDPIAEAAVYENFNVLVENKTAVFISHRLSSCRFCDSIAVFDHGQLIQQGSHDALAADADGKYSQLWHAQAQY